MRQILAWRGRYTGRFFLACLLAFGCLTTGGCGDSGDTGEAGLFEQWSDQKPGSLLQEKCAFTVPAGLEARCYRLVVAQDRERPGGARLAVAVAWVQKSGAPVSVDPVLYLEGGPGGASIPDRIAEQGEEGRSWADFGPVFDGGRALILVDGRGIGQSEPRLVCPRATVLSWRIYQKPPGARNETAYLRQVDRCLDELARRGVKFDNFNSLAMAQDLADLRRVLSIRQWNVYGVSYGVRTALELAKLDREGVRSIVYDSPSYQRSNVWQADQAAFDRVLSLVQYGCRTGELCSPAREGILNVLTRNLDKLDDDPPKVSLNFYSAPVYFDSELALYSLHLMLYYDDGASLFADAVDALSDRDQSWLRLLLELVHHEYELSGFSDVVNWATYCREQSLSGTYDGSGRFAIYDADSIGAMKHVCEKMGVAYDGAPFDGRTVAGLQSLVVSGERDPITPPSYGAQLARDVSAVGRYVVPKAAHGVMFDRERPCVQKMMRAFLDDPQSAPDDACAGDQ